MEVNLISTFAEFKELKNIDRPTMMSVLENIFRTQLEKMYGSADNFDIIINIDKGDLEIWRNREVVEKVEDPNTQISLEDVHKIDPSYEVGEDFPEEVKLSDFGRVRKRDADGGCRIRDDEVAGKPYYLAPEAYNGSYEAGPADVWSLGIILFILITGSPPFGIANDSDEVFEPFAEMGFGYLEPVLRSCEAAEEEIGRVGWAG